jgi:hypothetical protein
MSELRRLDSMFQSFLWGALVTVAVLAFWDPLHDPWAFYLLLAFGMLSITILADVVRACMRATLCMRDAAADRARTMALCIINVSVLLLWLLGGTVMQQSGGGDAGPSMGIVVLGSVLVLNSLIPLWMLCRSWGNEEFGPRTEAEAARTEAAVAARNIALAAVGLLALKTVRSHKNGTSIALLGWAAIVCVYLMSKHPRK